MQQSNLIGNFGIYFYIQIDVYMQSYYQHKAIYKFNSLQTMQNKLYHHLDCTIKMYSLNEQRPNCPHEQTPGNGGKENLPDRNVDWKQSRTQV